MKALTFTGGKQLERALKELGGKIAGRLGQNAAGMTSPTKSRPCRHAGYQKPGA
jgi:hypothetical protein